MVTAANAAGLTLFHQLCGIPNSGSIMYVFIYVGSHGWTFGESLRL